MFTKDFDDEMREAYNHRTRNKERQGLLISQLDYTDFNVPQKVFLEIVSQLKKSKLNKGEDPELITYSDYLWIFTECQSRPVRHQTIEEIYKKLKGSKNLTVSGLLALIQSKRPQTTEVDILNLLRRFGINYTEHEGILPREFIDLLGRAQRTT